MFPCKPLKYATSDFLSSNRFPAPDIFRVQLYALTMGCAASSASHKKSNLEPPLITTFLLTKNQKELIRHSWKLLQKRRTEIGVKVFLR